MEMLEQDRECHNYTGRKKHPSSPNAPGTFSEMLLFGQLDPCQGEKSQCEEGQSDPKDMLLL